MRVFVFVFKRATHQAEFSMVVVTSYYYKCFKEEKTLPHFCYSSTKYLNIHKFKFQIGTDESAFCSTLFLSIIY